jgi:hypothetical protein
LPLHAVVIRPPEGVASVDFTAPNDPTLVGLQLHAQALLLQLPWRACLTNATADVMVR